MINLGITCICMWRFHDAPHQLRGLSEHGGDEDWVAYIPKRYEGELLVDVMFEQDCGSQGFSRYFGCCDISKHTLHNGDVVYIGAHA